MHLCRLKYYLGLGQKYTTPCQTWDDSSPLHVQCKSSICACAYCFVYIEYILSDGGCPHMLVRRHHIHIKTQPPSITVIYMTMFSFCSLNNSATSAFVSFRNKVRMSGRCRQPPISTLTPHARTSKRQAPLKALARATKLDDLETKRSAYCLI